MAIRFTFYAEDQVTASSIVEFALSSQAVLQAYAEIDAPITELPKKGPPKKAPPKKDTPEKGSTPKRAYNMTKRKAQPKIYASGRRERHDYDNTFVVVMDRTNHATPGSKIWDIKDIILSHRAPVTLTVLRKSVFAGAPTSIATTVRKTIRDFISSGQLEIIEPPAKEPT